MSGIAGWGALAGGLAQSAQSTYEGIQRSKYGWKGSKEVEADMAGAKTAADIVGNRNAATNLRALAAQTKDPDMAARLNAIADQHDAYSGAAVPQVTAAGAGVVATPPGSNPAAAAPGGATPSASLSGSSTAPGNTDQMYP